MSRTAVSSGSGARGKTPHTREVQPMRSCFAALLWLVAACCVAAPAVTGGIAAAPSPVSTALVNVRRFTKPATDNLAFGRTADPLNDRGDEFSERWLRIAQIPCAALILTALPGV